MVFELIHNNRTIGADNKDIGEKIKKIYSTFCQGEIVITDIKTAEMTKVVENTYRAINIAFANELAKICRHDNMDIYEIIKICNMHPHVNILQPGPGVGGHCISVDPWFLVGDYPSLAKVIDVFIVQRLGGIEGEKKWIDFVNDHQLYDWLNVWNPYDFGYKKTYDIRTTPVSYILDKDKKIVAKKLTPKQTEDFINNRILREEKKLK